MYTVQFFGSTILCSFVHIMLSSAEDNNQADIIKHCMSSSNSTSCSLTYEQVYKSLTKNENNFNISYALYPEGGQPSFLVRVNVYGPNRTSNSIPAKFTWSIHCLYANVPAWALALWSLCSIFVPSRTQELNIQTPAFCCNISDDKEKREEIIKRFVRRALFELQDLAVSPEIRDPSLNTAECVIRGHQPSFETTGRSFHIRAMLWLSMLFVIFSGPLLAKVLLDLYVQSTLSVNTGKKAVMVMFLLFNNLLHPFTSFFFAFFLVGQVIKLSLESCFDLVGIIVCIIVSSTVESFFFAKWTGFPFQFPSFLSLLCGTNVISYTCCWMVIGFKINPTWGLTVVPFIIFFSAAVTYATYLYFEVIFPTGYDFNLYNTKLCGRVFVYRLTLIGRRDNRQTTEDITDDEVAFFKDFVPSHPPKAKIVCVRGCLAVWLLFVIVILAGHSNTGKEMAVGEVLGTVSLYFSTAFVSWLTWKKRNSKDRTTRYSPERDTGGQNGINLSFETTT